MTVKELHRGQFFCLKDLQEPKDSQIWIRDGYDPAEKKYEAHRWDDVNHFRLFSGKREVFTDFIF